MSDDKENAMDYNEHEKSYEIFIAIAKWGTIASIIGVSLLAFITL